MNREAHVVRLPASALLQIEVVLASKLEALLEGSGVYDVGETRRSVLALVRDELDRWRSTGPNPVIALEFLDAQACDGRVYTFHERDGRWSLLAHPFDSREKMVRAIERALGQLGLELGD